jgi:hypothetical protein
MPTLTYPFQKVSMELRDDQDRYAGLGSHAVRDDEKIASMEAAGWVVTRRWTVVGPRQVVEGWAA